MASPGNETNYPLVGDKLQWLSSFFEFLNENGNKFSGFVFGVFLGLLIGWIFMSITLRTNRRHYKETIEEKRREILELKSLVHDRLDRIKVPVTNKIWFERLKDYFYKS